MAIYVMLLKEHEDETRVVYRFGSNEEEMGRISFDKVNGRAEELDPIPGPPRNPRLFFEPAAAKLFQHWHKGTFPERTSWSS